MMFAAVVVQKLHLGWASAASLMNKLIGEFISELLALLFYVEHHWILMLGKFSQM